MKNYEELRELFKQLQEDTAIVLKQQGKILDVQSKILDVLYPDQANSLTRTEDKPINLEEGD
jgi:hypothetical protein